MNNKKILHETWAKKIFKKLMELRFSYQISNVAAAGLESKNDDEMKPVLKYDSKRHFPYYRLDFPHLMVKLRNFN